MLYNNNDLGISRVVIMRQKSHYPRVEYGLLGFADVMNEKRIARFWSKVDRAGEGLCHPWRGSRNAQGYGLFQGAVAYAGYSFLAHRLAFWLANGSQSSGRYRAAYLRQSVLLQPVAPGRGNTQRQYG